jgi:hypothetical protein
MLSEADILYIRDSSTHDLQEEVRYSNDAEYITALAEEISRRARNKAAAIAAKNKANSK